MLSPSRTYLSTWRRRQQIPGLLTLTINKGSGVAVMDGAFLVATQVDVVRLSW